MQCEGSLNDLGASGELYQFSMEFRGGDGDGREK